MFKNNERIFSDAGKYLVDGVSVGLSLPIECAGSAEEKNVIFDDIEIRSCSDFKIAVCSNNMVSFLIPQILTYDEIKKSIITKRYSEEDKVAIMLYKDTDDTYATEFERFKEWSEFAEKLAKIIAPLVGVEITESLEDVKSEMIKTINKYDTSSAVNSFVYNGAEIWLDKATRVGLMNSTTILKQAGQENTTLWLGDVNVTLPCDNVIFMLSQIEMYALECYNVTAQHKSEVMAMATIEEVKNFDYKAGYPERLVY